MNLCVLCVFQTRPGVSEDIQGSVPSGYRAMQTEGNHTGSVICSVICIRVIRNPNDTVIVNCLRISFNHNSIIMFVIEVNIDVTVIEVANGIVVVLLEICNIIMMID